MNGVYETTTTSGTGTITLSAVTGRPRFADVAGVGDLVPYSIKDGDNSEWGYGSVSAGNTLARSVIKATYVSGVYDNTSPTAITLSGLAADVYLSPIADSIVPARGFIGTAYGRKAVYSAHWTTGPTSTLAVGADRLYLVPFLADGSYDINGFYSRMTVSGAAGTKARIGLYRLGTDGAPTTLICETADIDTSVAAAVISPAVAQVRINPGWYAIGFVCSGSPTFQATASAAHGNNPWGISDLAAEIAPIEYVYKTIAGWSSLPTNPTGITKAIAGINGVPAIALKIV